MSKIKTAIDIILHNRKIFFRVLYDKIRRTKLLHILSDKSFIRLTDFFCFGERINLSAPKTFNEKLNWLKLNFRQPIMRKLVDKYEVKQYVASRIGKEFVIPTLGIWDSYDSIDLSNMPNRFVLKGTHDSSSVIICKDKSTFQLAKFKKKILHSLNSDLYYWGREWSYKGLSRRIIAEQFIVDKSGDLRDYKFFCFNGKVRCFKIDFDRFVNHRANYYDEKCNLLSISEDLCPADFREVEIPSNIYDMMRLAEVLATDFPFVRVDFYDVEGRIYFGEMTFFPAAGFGRFTTPEADSRLGSWLTLPEKM